MSAPCLTQPKTLDDMLLYRLWRLQSRAGRVVIRLCEDEFSITRREWRLLAHLAREEGVLSSHLAERADLDRVRTSRTLGTLERKGLIERTPRPGNRREVCVRLSESGRALHAALLPRVAAINQALLGALSQQEASELEGLLARLHQRAEDMASNCGSGRAARSAE